jgi:hypothetical protein
MPCQIHGFKLLLQYQAKIMEALVAYKRVSGSTQKRFNLLSLQNNQQYSLRRFAPQSGYT